jgi:hypothetical protein
VLLALLGSFMVSYASAKAEALRAQIPRGSMRRPERAAYLIIGAGLTPLLAPLVASHVPGATGWLLEIPALGAVALVALVSNVSAVSRLSKLAIAVGGPRSPSPTAPARGVEVSAVSSGSPVSAVSPASPASVIPSAKPAPSAPVSRPGAREAEVLAHVDAGP